MEIVVMVCIFLLVPLLILMGNKQTKKLNEEKENDDKFIKETVGNYDNCKTYSYRDILKEISRYCIDIKDNKVTASRCCKRVSGSLFSMRCGR